MKRLIFSRRMGLLALASAAWPRQATAEPSFLWQPWPRGQATPAVALPDLQGQPWTPAAAAGQVLLLNVWASWCEPCRDELPDLADLQRRLGPQGLQVVAVNHREGEATLRRFLASQPLDLPVLRDAEGRVARDFGLRIFPSTVVLGRDGRVRGRVVGDPDWAGPDAQALLAPLLAEPRPARA